MNLFRSRSLCALARFAASARIVRLFTPLLALLFLFPSFVTALPRNNQKAPDFELQDLDGVARKLSDYNGKAVLLNFWATWCAQCVEEIPGLNTLYDRLGNEGLVVVGVSIDRSRQDLDRLAVKPAYPVLMDEKGRVFVKQYTVTRLPATIIIDRDGFVVKTIIGPQDFGSGAFADKIKRLLEGKERHE